MLATFQISANFGYNGGGDTDYSQTPRKIIKKKRINENINLKNLQLFCDFLNFWDKKIPQC